MHDRIEEQEIANIKSSTASLKSKVGTVPSGKTVQGQITELSEAVGTVPSGKTVQGQISELAEALAALTTRVETLEG